MRRLIPSVLIRLLPVTLVLLSGCKSPLGQSELPLEPPLFWPISSENTLSSSWLEDSIHVAATDGGTHIPLPGGARARLDSTLQVILERTGTAGYSAAVMDAEGAVWSGSCGALVGCPGWTDEGDTLGGTLEDLPLPHAASTGKFLTAILVMKAIEGGAFALDDPVVRWYPQVETEICIRHLLNHSSGIPSFDMLPDYQALQVANPDELIEMSLAAGRVFAPGTYWSYSNTGYLMLGRILEATSGRDYANLLQEQILDVVPMPHTRLLSPTNQEQAVATGYHGGVTLEEHEIWSNPWAAGPVATCPSDLVACMRALLEGKLLQSATMDQMLQNMHLQALAPKVYYGFGCYIIQSPLGDLIGHAGGICGQRSALFVHRQSGRVLSVMTNDDISPPEPAIFMLLAAMIE